MQYLTIVREGEASYYMYNKVSTKNERKHYVSHALAYHVSFDINISLAADNES